MPFIRLYTISQAQIDSLPTGNTTNSSSNKEAQDKTQEPQVSIATERATSLALVFFAKYTMLDLSFKKKNIVSHSQPDSPRLPLVMLFLKEYLCSRILYYR